MKYSVVDTINDAVMVKKPVTLEKVRVALDHICDPPYTVVFLKKGEKIYDYCGRTPEGDAVLGRVLYTLGRNGFFVHDKDGCLWLRGAKDTLEMTLAMAGMIQGTKAQKL